MPKPLHPGRWAFACTALVLLLGGGGASPQAAPPAQAVPPDAIATFIASLETEYAAAFRLYRQGQLDEARQGFDATLDRLLSSNYSIPNTPRLQTELDSLLDRIQALESDALASGGLNQAQPQATPLERIPELTFPLDAATREQIQGSAGAGNTTSGSGQLPLVLNDAVLRYIHYFSTTGRADLVADFRRGGRYRAMVERIFAAEGVPADLFFMAQLESDFNPRLVSRAGARGMWQFMAVRSDDYGLRRTAWVDERQDPDKSTLAAARHLKDLYGEFGTWYLAMAAYNTGPRIIQQAVARTGYADYWKISALGALPRTVRDYVPVILAIAFIAHNPQKYGLEDLQVDPPDETETIDMESAVDLRLAAECAQVTVADLQHLNPSLLHLRVPAGYGLQVPADAAARFRQGLAQVPAADRLAWRLHWVQPGESWPQLARRYHVSVARLGAANHLATTHAPVLGTPLAVPMAAATPSHRTASPAAKKKTSPAAHL